MTELKNKFVYQLIVSATQVLLPLLTYPYITRVLGPAHLGRINYVDFLGQAFIIFAAFGIPYYAVRAISLVRNDAGRRSLLVSEMAVLSFIFAVMAAAGFILFTYRNWGNYPLLYLLGVVNILFSTFSFEWYLQGTEAFRFAATRTVVVRLAMIAAFYLLVKREEDYIVYFSIFTVTTILISLLNCYRVLSENNLTTRHLHLKKHLQPLWHFFLTSSAISLYIYFDTILLQKITHDEQAVGYYTTVLKMVKIFLLLMLVSGTVLMPRLSWLAGTGNTAEVSRHLNRLLQFIMIAGIPIGTGLLLLAPEIINTISGEKFLPAVPLMRTLAFLPLIIGLSNLFCFQTLVPYNQERKLLSIVVIGCVASIGMDLLFIPRLGAMGAATANMITELIITCLSGWYAGRLVQFDCKPAVILQTVLTCLLFIPVIFACRYFFNSSLLILLAAVPSCMLMYWVCQVLLFKNKVIIETNNYFINLLKM